jgi:hypothetical protein
MGSATGQLLWDVRSFVAIIFRLVDQQRRRAPLGQPASNVGGSSSDLECCEWNVDGETLMTVGTRTMNRDIPHEERHGRLFA